MIKSNVTKILVVIMMLYASLFIVTGCTTNISKEIVREPLIIADQFGLAYAPLEVMKHERFLEKALEKRGLKEIEIEWRKFGNTAAIREAMLSGGLDIGFVGIPPFLLGFDNGMPWRIISGLSESRVTLVSKDPSVQSLSDIGAEHRIILPQPGSIQHILLQMAAERALGDANAFDDHLLALSHPDGVIAFSSGDANQLHFTTPPFLQEDLKVEGAFELIDGEACFGDSFTFIVGICQESLYEDSDVYDAFREALELSVTFMDTNREETLSIIASVYDYDETTLASYLAEDQLRFTTEVNGLDRFVEFMHKNGMIGRLYENDTLIWE